MATITWANNKWKTAYEEADDPQTVLDMALADMVLGTYPPAIYNIEPDDVKQLEPVSDVPLHLQKRFWSLDLK